MKKNKKVILIYGFSANFGGIEQYLFYLIDRLQNENTQIICLIPNHDIAYIKKFSDYHIELVRAPSRKKVWRHLIFFIQLFRQYRIDILHMNVNTLSYSELIYLSKILRTTIILHSHSSSSSSGKLSLILHLMNKFIISFFSLKRVAVSKKAGLWLFGKRDFDIIHNGIDLQKFQFNKNSRCIIRTKYGIANDEIVLGHVGHLAYPKNQFFLIELMAYLNNFNDKKYKLLMIGNGEDKGNLMSEVSSRNIGNIVFVGSSDDVHEFYSSFDVFVFPSFFEGYPLAVLEAQVSGLPIILSSSITNEVIITKRVWQRDLVVSSWVEIIRSMNFLEDRRSNLFDSLDVQESISKILNVYSTYSIK